MRYGVHSWVWVISCFVHFVPALVLSFTPPPYLNFLSAWYGPNWADASRSCSLGGHLSNWYLQGFQFLVVLCFCLGYWFSEILCKYDKVWRFWWAEWIERGQWLVALPDISDVFQNLSPIKPVWTVLSWESSPKLHFAMTAFEWGKLGGYPNLKNLWLWAKDFSCTHTSLYHVCCAKLI